MWPKGYLHDYKEIVVGSRNEGAENVNHVYYMVNAKDKYLALKRIVDFYPKIYAIVFCRTKRETQEIADKLIRDGYNAESLHGDLSQPQRDLTMQKFRSHLTRILVATDVAARGLDVDDLTHVINYGLPSDIESYTHRSGRTGRAGKKGTSISIIHSRERSKIRSIEKEIGKAFEDGTLPTPEEICKKQLYKQMDAILKTDVDDDLIAPYMEDIKRQFEYIDKEDIIKKMVTVTFGRFLDYYKDAPEIEKPNVKGCPQGARRRGQGQAKQGRETRGRLCAPLHQSRKDGWFLSWRGDAVCQQARPWSPGGGPYRPLGAPSYIEVPQEDAAMVMKALDGSVYKGRKVRCNDANEGRPQREDRKEAPRRTSRPGKSSWGERGDQGRRPGRYDRERPSRRAASVPMYNDQSTKRHYKKDDWKMLMNGNAGGKLRGDEPDFSEEGWADAIRRSAKES